MKRHSIYLLLLLAATLLAGCATDEAAPAEPDNTIRLGVQAVAAPTTRAQHTGSMDFALLKSTGFGVYGSIYGSKKGDDGQFWTNTKVTFEEGGTAPTTNLDIPGSWTYGTLKEEWEKDAEYTFFAYAPYMDKGDESLSTAPGKTGIVAIEDASGDPKIGYIVSNSPEKSVDLLWGVRSDTGKPWTDIRQGQTNSAVLFTFYHALCAVGFHAQVIVDQQNRLTELDDESNLGTIGKADGCKVTLNRVILKPQLKLSEGGNGFHTSAYLNLNNSTPHQPNWTGHEMEKYEGIYVSGDRSEINPKLADPAPSDFLDQNPTNTSFMTNADVPGITESANTQSVIKDDKLFMLIPQDAQDYTVEVEYFITYKTATGYHRDAHTGTATITGLKLEAGVKYYINLVFGLTTFKVSVDAEDWEESTTPVTIATETGTSAGHSLVRRKTDDTTTKP